MKKLLLLFILFISLSNVYAQGDYLKFKPYQHYKWMIGIGWVATDGYNVKNNINLFPYPTQLTVDRLFKYGISAEVGFSYAKYNQIFTSNYTQVTANFDTTTQTTYYDTTNVTSRTTTSGTMLAVDLMCRYSWHRYMPAWFDPYVGLGIGLTYRMGPTSSFSPTVNVSAGMIFWAKNFGFRVQAMGKANIIDGIITSPNNYLAYSAGIQYKFPIKEKSKSTFGKRKHGWVHQKAKYKGKSK